MTDTYHKTLLKTAPMAFWQVDAQALITEVNDAACKLSGYTEQELLKLHVYEVDATDHSENSVKARMKRMMSSNEVQRFETQHRRKDGTLYDVATSAKHIGDGQFIAFFEDITERKWLETVLLETGERYRALVETQMEAVCRWLPDMTLTFVNAGYCKTYGKTKEALIGSSWLDLVPEKSRPGVQKFYENLVRSPKECNYDHEVIGVDGELRWEHWTDVPIFSKDGTLLEFQSVGRDITERKQFENKLRESEEMFAVFMQHSPAYVYIKEVTPTESRTLRASDNFHKMTGKPVSEIIGKTMSEILDRKSVG